jgi:predicted PurR-regulated permease PerM
MEVIMKLTGWDRFCVSVILTCGALGGSYWAATYLFNIPVGHVITIMVTAVAISAGLRIPVRYLRWLCIPKWLSIISIYIGFFALLAWASARAAPQLRDQVNSLIQVMKAHWVSPKELTSLIPPSALEYIPTQVLDKITAIGNNGIGQVDSYLNGIASLASNLFTIIMATGMDLVLLLMFIFFLSYEEGLISSYATKFIPSPERRKIIKDVIDHTMHDLGSWAIANLVIGISFGSLFGTLLSAFRIPFGFTIGLVGFLSESVLPMLGGIFTLIVLAIPAGLEANGGWGAVTVLCIYAGVFFLQWHVIYLYVMGRALKFDAFVTLFFMWVGYFPLGIMGSVLVLPIMVIAANILKVVCPITVEEGDPNGLAHEQVIQTVVHWLFGFNTNYKVRNQLCHRWFGADLRTPLYKQAFSAFVRWVQAIIANLRSLRQRRPTNVNDQEPPAE